MALRYDWQPSRIPTNCSCGKKFTVEHAFTCPKGGFPILRHNEIRDLTANLLAEVCHDVSIEPNLQPLTGEVLSEPSSIGQDGARLDIAASGCWGGRHERTYFDVRVFNPHAPSNRSANLSSCYRKHERIKKNAYEQRIREVEHASFTPLVYLQTYHRGDAQKATMHNGKGENLHMPDCCTVYALVKFPSNKLNRTWLSLVNSWQIGAFS